MSRRDNNRTLALEDPTDERRRLTLLALFVLAVMLLPAPSGAQQARPTAGEGAEPIAQPTTPPDVPEAAEVLGQFVDEPAEEESADEAADDGAAGAEAEGEETAEVPEPPAEEQADDGGAVVQAEGQGTEEVVTAPVAPDAEGGEEGAAAADGDAAAASGDAAQAPLEPAPVTVTYGTSTVPSLGTTARPLTTDGLASPMVLVPMVAGAEAAGTASPVSVQPSTALQTLATPISGVAAGGLAGVQPSAAAFTAAALMVLIVAAYSAVLRRRGEDVPEVIRLTDAIRPVDRRATAVRSIRPADMTRSARSVRP